MKTKQDTASNHPTILNEDAERSH